MTKCNNDDIEPLSENKNVNIADSEITISFVFLIMGVSLVLMSKPYLYEMKEEDHILFEATIGVFFLMFFLPGCVFLFTSIYVIYTRLTSEDLN